MESKPSDLALWSPSKPSDLALWSPSKPSDLAALWSPNLQIWRHYGVQTFRFGGTMEICRVDKAIAYPPDYPIVLSTKPHLNIFLT